MRLPRLPTPGEIGRKLADMLGPKAFKDLDPRRLRRAALGLAVTIGFLTGVGGLLLSNLGAPDDRPEPSPIVPGAPAPATVQPATSLVPTSIAGSWRVHTYDLAGGEFIGRAVVSEDEKRATIVYADPATGERVRIDTSTIVRDGATVRITLDGARPAFGIQVHPPAGDVLTGGPGLLRLSLGNGAGTVTVATPTPPDETKTEIELTIAPGSMAGAWRRRVAAERVPGAPFAGRQGAITYLDDGTGQLQLEGQESWVRIDPVIEVVVPIQRSLGRDEFGVIRYAHPDGLAGKDGIVSGDRTLLVLGRDLPTERGEPVVFGPPAGGIAYSLVAKAVDFADQKAWVDQGYAILKSAVPPETFGQLLGLDAVLVRASFGADVLPGVQPISINGAEGGWLLRFGDFSGRIDFARMVGDGETEGTDVVVAPETVVVELTPDRDLKRDAIDVVLFVDDAPVVLSDPAAGPGTKAASRRFPARRIATTRIDAETGAAKPAVVYRTPPIDLVASDVPGATVAGSARVVAPAGTTLRAIVADPGIYEPRPRAAAAKVATSPAEVAGARNPKHVDNNLTWSQALVQALRCARIDPADALQRLGALDGSDGPADVLSRLSRLSQIQVETFGNLVVLNPTTTLLEIRRRAFQLRIASAYQPKWFTVGVTAGDHAAMLMLRDAFDDLMEEQEIAWSSDGLRDEGLDGMRDQLGDVVFDNDQPFRTLSVKAPDGTDVEFWRTFVADPELERRYGLDADGLRSWRRRTMREAIDAYRGWIAESRRRAQAVDACSVEKLLDLTAFGFGGIEREMGPRLLRPAGDRWEPDRVARAFVFGHTTLAEAVQAQRDLSSKDTDRVLLAAGIAGGIGGAAFGTVSAAWLAFAIDVGDLGITSVKETVQLVAAERERAFARGATAVLGAGRYARARRAADLQWVAAAGQVALGAVAAADSLIDTWQLASLKSSIARGQQLIEATAPSAFQRLSREAQDDVLNAVEEARRLRAALGGGLPDAARGLAPIERRAFDFGENLRAEYLGRPSWARDLPGEAYAAVAEMRLRPDVRRLVEADPGRLARLVTDPDGREVLRGSPAGSFEALDQAVRREKSKVKSPIGAEFFDDMARTRPNPLGFQITDEVEQYPEGALFSYSDINIGNVEVGSFKRSRFTANGKYTLVLEASELHEGAPGWIGTARMNFLPNPQRPGIPVALYMNTRAISNLGIGFADPRLTTVLISNITNGQTAVQLLWLRKYYPDTPIDDLLKYTHSFGYAETALTQAGFRITGVRLVPKPVLGRTSVETLLGGPGTWFRADVDWRTYIARYGISAEETIERGHTFELTVAPFR